MLGLLGQYNLIVSFTKGSSQGDLKIEEESTSALDAYFLYRPMLERRVIDILGFGVAEEKIV